MVCVAAGLLGRPSLLPGALPSLLRSRRPNVRVSAAPQGGRTFAHSDKAASLRYAHTLDLWELTIVPNLSVQAAEDLRWLHRERTAASAAPGFIDLIDLIDLARWRVEIDEIYGARRAPSRGRIRAAVTSRQTVFRGTAHPRVRLGARSHGPHVHRAPGEQEKPALPLRVVGPPARESPPPRGILHRAGQSSPSATPATPHSHCLAADRRRRTAAESIASRDAPTCGFVLALTHPQLRRSPRN